MSTKKFTVNIPQFNEARPVAEIVQTASQFESSIYLISGNLAWQNEKSDIKYSSQWADGISQITFAIERFTRTEDGTTREVTITTELVSDPVTIDVK